MLRWAGDEPVMAATVTLACLAAVLLARWAVVSLACRFTSRLHVEAAISYANWRVAMSLLVATGLVALAFAPSIGTLQMPSLGLACCLLAATGILGGADFREYGLLAGGVLIPWSRVKQVEWVEKGQTCIMWIQASWCLPLAVRVNCENKQAVDRLVRSAARYERLPVTYWLSNLVVRAIIAALVVAAVILVLT